MPKNSYWKYKDIDTFKEKVDEYFDVMDTTGRPYTVSGLAYYLGTNRMTLLNYRNKRDEFADVIDEAKAKIEQFNEEMLYMSNKTAGVIFNLKNNFGWKDQQEVTVSNNNQNVLAELSTEDIKALLEKSEDEVIEKENP